MQDPDASMGLCCLPIQIQAKYYPPVLILIFCLFFGFDLSLFAGLAVGYIHAFGYLTRFEMSIPKAAEWEAKFPFKNWSTNASKFNHCNITLFLAFVKAGGGMAGEIIPTA